MTEFFGLHRPTAGVHPLRSGAVHADLPGPTFRKNCQTIAASVIHFLGEKSPCGIFLWGEIIAYGGSFDLQQTDPPRGYVFNKSSYNILTEPSSTSVELGMSEGRGPVEVTFCEEAERSIGISAEGRSSILVSNIS